MNLVTTDIFHLLDNIGTIAFAISGSMVAIEKKADLFGVCLMGLTTAVGGGIIRDIVLGQTPPRIFQAHGTLMLALITSLIIFAMAYFARGIYSSRQAVVDKVNNVFDAMGLGVFTVTGMRIAIESGAADVVLIIFLGAVTGIGGGLMRDLILNEIPFVMKKYVYAVASICGGCCYWWLLKSSMLDDYAMVISILVVFVLRICATIFRWNLPKVV